MSEQDRIAALLAAYGSDLSRWPADGRAIVEALPAKERDALLRDDEALDQLVAGAAQDTAGAPPPDDLIARILAAAPVEDEAARMNRAGGSVISARSISNTKANGRPAMHRPARNWAAAAAVLAASLMLGIFIGSTDRGQTAARSVGELAGFNLSASSVQMTELDEALQSQDDEDIL